MSVIINRKPFYFYDASMHFSFPSGNVISIKGYLFGSDLAALQLKIETWLALKRKQYEGFVDIEVDAPCEDLLSCGVIKIDTSDSEDIERCLVVMIPFEQDLELFSEVNYPTADRWIQ